MLTPQTLSTVQTPGLPSFLPVQRDESLDASGTTVSAPAETPYLRLDLTKAVGRYRRLAAALPVTAVHYAVKANPDPGLLHELVRAGCRFDIATPAEARAALAAGAAPEHLVCSHPVKRRDHLEETASLGVRLFVVDSMTELRKVAEVAPRSSVLCRLVTSGKGSDWPLSRKFGCSTQEAVDLLTEAASLHLDPAGVCFHVGSQQHDPEAWRAPIEASAQVFDRMSRRGLPLRLLDLGGGFPATLEGGCPPVEAYGAAIDRHLESAFGPSRPETLVEPGRGVVGDAGTLVSTVIAVIDRGPVRWVYLDAGVFTGLVETLGEAIRYRVETSADHDVLRGPCVLAGPTCDSADVLYEDRMVALPRSLAEGDVVRLLSAGAYTACYSTVGFNGFAPLRTVTGSR